MLEVTRIKKTRQIVFPVGTSDRSGYTEVLFPFGRISKKGNRGVVQNVKNDNLIKDREVV